MNPYITSTKPLNFQLKAHDFGTKKLDIFIEKRIHHNKFSREIADFAPYIAHFPRILPMNLTDPEDRPSFWLIIEWVKGHELKEAM